MPKMTGFTLIRSLSKPPYIILTTAHREFALESYNLNVIDYLLKPISFERFMKAVGKVLQLEKIQQAHPENKGAQLVNTDEAPFIYMKSDRQFIKVLLDEILYMESIKNHVKIITQKEILITLVTIFGNGRKITATAFFKNTQKLYSCCF